MLNPGSDRTIGGAYYTNNPKTLEEQIAQKSELIFLQTVYNEGMIHRFESDLKSVKQAKKQPQKTATQNIDTSSEKANPAVTTPPKHDTTVSTSPKHGKASPLPQNPSNASKSKQKEITVEKLEFNKYMDDFEQLHQDIKSNHASMPMQNALDNFIKAVKRAKEEWIADPSRGDIFVKNCQEAVKNAKNSPLQDFSEWNILARGFMKAINLLPSWLSDRPVFQTNEYAKISIFSYKIKTSKVDTAPSDNIENVSPKNK